MTEAEVQALIATPTDEVIAAAKEELKDYTEDLNTLGLGETIDKINSEIDEGQAVKVEQVEYIHLSDAGVQGNKKGGQRKDKK